MIKKIASLVFLMAIVLVPIKVNALNYKLDNNILILDPAVYEPKPTENFCADRGVRLTFRAVGYLIFVIKILVPILIIIFGTISFTKAIIGSKDDEIKKAGKALALKFVAGIVIFFLPTIIDVVIQFIPIALGMQKQSDVPDDYDMCRICLFHSDECDV